MYGSLYSVVFLAQDPKLIFIKHFLFLSKLLSGVVRQRMFQKFTLLLASRSSLKVTHMISRAPSSKPQTSYIRHEDFLLRSLVRPTSVTLRGPPLDSEMGWTGELWSKTKFLILEN